MGRKKPMDQFNLKVPASFRRNIRLLMKLKGYASRSEAIRAAVEEAVERARDAQPTFADLVGSARDVPAGHRPRFRSNRELWERR